jgi:hypothetical protein
MKLEEFKLKYAQEEEKRRVRAAKAAAAEATKPTRRENSSPDVEVITGAATEEDAASDEEYTLEQLLEAHSLMSTAIKYLSFYGDKALSGSTISKSDQFLMNQLSEQMQEFIKGLEEEGLVGENEYCQC